MENDNYPIGQCDVKDKKSLAKYRTKRKIWLEWLRGDPDHSIVRQICTMLWNDAIFRLINESRRIALQSEQPSCVFNRAIGAFTDQGYVATQVLAIRRLLDKRKDIISLPRLLTDIEANWRLITRENYVSHDSVPYDPQASVESVIRHEAFDKLSRIRPDDRGPRDKICPVIFACLNRRLERSGASRVIQLGNKFIAHAADYQSRQQLNNAQQSISFAKLDACHRAICRTAHAISTQLLWDGGHGLMPIPQYDVLEHLDQPWLSQADVQTLQAFWDHHCDNVKACTRAAPDELSQEIFDDMKKGIVE
jgi:hypothetical protein